MRYDFYYFYYTKYDFLSILRNFNPAFVILIPFFPPTTISEDYNFSQTHFSTVFFIAV